MANEMNFPFFFRVNEKLFEKLTFLNDMTHLILFQSILLNRTNIYVDELRLF